MPLYEHVFLARQDASTQQVEELTTQMTGIVEGLGGKITKTENWGVRSLTYRMNKNRKAHFVLMNIDAPSAAVTEIERQVLPDGGHVSRNPGALIELLLDLFTKSFALELVPAGPGAVAGRGALPANLEPTPELAFGFAGLPGRPIAGEDGDGTTDGDDDEEGIDG